MLRYSRGRYVKIRHLVVAMVPLSAVLFSCRIWLIVIAKYASEEGEYGITIRALFALSHRLLSTYLVLFICISLVYFVTCSFPPYFQFSLLGVVLVLARTRLPTSYQISPLMRFDGHFALTCLSHAPIRGLGDWRSIAT